MEKSTKVCVICSLEGIYKCPTCFIYYCSSKCCKQHREDNCQLRQKPEPTLPSTPTQPSSHPEEVPSERLQLLQGSEEVKSLLANPHLRDLLATIDSSENAQQTIQKAMLEPIFVEFADACIKAVEPESPD